MPGTAQQEGSRSFLLHSVHPQPGATSSGNPLFQDFSPIPVQGSTDDDCIKVGRKIDPMINSKVGRKETTSDDIDAYDLIMKNKELLLDCDPKRSPVRFIFLHSALREGWDNPNVFQIRTLKSSSSEIRKRQEVGRGMRLSVNQDGERMDATSNIILSLRHTPSSRILRRHRHFAM